ncbi:Putative 2-dehydropantoate 2-reductase [Zhongshania aliphaticivorans]|uniref:2-dehydropantoate 2-reductase n=1 Tax=Zhongshania aliphaticivorans TaxID=1470434 RepID=A0A5S9PYR7_9GAMM|nr:2-dehydropantoate 2-reductase [Zhongshania aliphaticivorans]CAA0092352.1 Putative 2-dehydropantoate 2-reductase [Zhongshania aliphaticivorans]CAA0109616.1 Putative 2-dehydropantoate 2-reductase [Zhongshania aliphaticivorans]
MALRIGIIGAGSIGCYVGAALAMGGAETSFLARERIANIVAEHGLRISDFRGLDHHIAPAHLCFFTDIGAMADRECVIVTVKSGDTEAVAADLAKVIDSKAIVISLQNGVGNAAVLQKALPNHTVLAGMIAFNVLQGERGHFHAGTDGEVIIQESAMAQELAAFFLASGTPFETHDNMTSVLWSKLLLNLNNPINALSGIGLKDQLSQRAYRLCLAALQREALAVLGSAGIPIQKMTAVPATWMPALLSLPDFVFKRFAQSMLAIDPVARSSMWEDLERGRKTEVEWLNGEVIRLGENYGLSAPANERVRQLIQQAERGGRRDYKGDELLKLISA